MLLKNLSNGYDGVGACHLRLSIANRARPRKVVYGHDTESALAFVSQFLSVQEALSSLNENAREQAQERLRALLETHHTPHGIFFDSRLDHQRSPCIAPL